MARSDRARRRWNFAACSRCARRVAHRVARILPPASVLPTLFVAPAWAADFELHPTLTLAQHYSDNISLAPAGLERSGWVTEVRPGLTFLYNGARLKFRASAGAEMLYRSNDGSTEVNPQFTGGTLGSLEIVPQHFYLDTDSSISQQNTSLQGPLALNNINTTTNRTTVRTTRLSPYYLYSFDNEARGELRYTYTQVASDSGPARGADSGGNRFDARLTSGPAYKRTTWRIAYYWDRINYDLARDTTSESVTAGVRHLLTPVVGLLVNAGYEDNNYISTTTSPKGSYWSAGLDWTPTPRTRLAATRGERFYGRTYSLDFNHRTRLTVWNLTYSEEITTYRQEVFARTQVDTAQYLDTLYQGRFPDPIERQRAVQQAIEQAGLPPTLLTPVNFYTNQTYLSKSWRGTAGLQGRIHTVFVNFFSTDREEQSIALPGGAGDFAASPTIRQTGAGLTWNWRITPLDASTVSTGFSRYESPGSDRQDDYKYLRVAYRRQLGRDVSGGLQYQRLDSDSSTGAGGYKENQVAAHLSMRF